MSDQSEDDSTGFGETLERISEYFSRASDSIYRRVSRFTYTRVGPENVLLVFLALLIATLVGGRTMAIVSPFSGLSVYGVLIFSFIALVTGHYFAGRLTRDGRLRWSIIHLPLSLTIVYFLLAFHVFSLDGSPAELRIPLGYLTLVQLSLLGGVLSGDIKSAPWLGRAVYLRWIMPQLKKDKIHFLYWSRDGELRLLEPDKIEPWWDEKSGKVNVSVDGHPIPFHHFAPVMIEDQHSIQKIFPALSRVEKLFSNLIVAWSGAMSQYKTAIQEGHSRISWLVLLQLVIPIHASSLATQNSKIPGRSQRIEIGEEVISLDWPIENRSWNAARTQLFVRAKVTPALHTALRSHEPPENALAVELELLDIKSANEDVALVGVHLLRSYTHLMLMLFENLSSVKSTRSELCKRCIRPISAWYVDFITGDFLAEISNLANSSDRHFSSDSITFDEWSSTFNEALVEPSTKFLHLHDQLADVVHSESESEASSLELNGSILNLISTCTQDVIAPGSPRPGAPTPTSSQMRLGSSRELGVSRKAALLIGICKMEMVRSLLHRSWEDVS